MYIEPHDGSRHRLRGPCMGRHRRVGSPWETGRQSDGCWAPASQRRRRFPPWPSVAAKRKTASTTRPTTASGPTA